VRAGPTTDGLQNTITAIDPGDEPRDAEAGMDRSPAPPPTTDILATAGGVVFAGAFDRTFSAYDAATGKQLWKTRAQRRPRLGALGVRARSVI
jgi:glucose dehydrogenase